MIDKVPMENGDTKSDFVSPAPMVWNEIYSRLCRVAKKNGWENPPIPLILAAWWDTPVTMKMLRWKETTDWAQTHGVTDLIPELTEDQKHYRED